MHYGDGMMKEEIERARKRAEAASGRNNDHFGYEYQSPLGAGFTFSGSTGNPFSKSGRKRMQNQNKGVSGSNSFFDDEYEYEEGYMDMGSNSTSSSKQYKMRGREIVSERMKERRKARRRNRGDPLRSYSSNNPQQDDNSSCAVM